MDATHDEPQDFFVASKRWTARHDAEIAAWLELQALDDGIERDTARFAAAALVSVPEMRGVGHVPGEPLREALRWDEIDAYEILFQHVVHGGLMPGWSEAAYLRFMGSFAQFLGERGIIPAREHAQLEREFATWAARLLEVWNEGGWYERSGRHIAPEPPPPRERAPATGVKTKRRTKHDKGRKTGARVRHRRGTA